jgi:two-component system chemotaxis response regulator CheB
MKRRSLNVLVVDDSAVVRQVMTAVLSRARDIKVTAAADPLIAITKMRQSRPDVILLDLEMPRMDGLTFLEQIMSEDPIPVVVCSGRAGRGSDAALRALEKGAVEIVAKPEFSVGEFIEEKASTFIEAVRGAAAAKLRRRIAPTGVDRIKTAELRQILPTPPGRISSTQIIAVGASTGGTEAIRELLLAMPTESPPILIVQHMPEGYTAAFAKRLNATCRLDVKEATDGDALVAGRALVAPGNRHMLLVRRGSRFAVDTCDGPLISRHRPSVDALFRSVARMSGANAVGVLLTGMGSDGAEGLLEMKRAGAATIAQDETSCVVFGMPKEAIAIGAADEVLPLTLIPRAILKHAGARQNNATGPQVSVRS